MIRVHSPYIAASAAPALLAALLLSGCAQREAPPRSLGQPVAVEVEPNGSLPTATPLGASGVVRGSISAGDHDWYAIQALAGDRVYAATMTAASTVSGDTVLSLFNPDGVTSIQFDDDHGAFGGLSSTIAGAIIPADGTYYLHVRGFSTTTNVTTYDLHWRVIGGAPDVEIEPNDTSTATQALPPSGWVEGVLSTTVDQDWYSLTVPARSTLFLSLDTNPLRDPTGWNGHLQILTSSGGPLTANDTSSTGAAGSQSSQALFATAAADEEIRIGVRLGTGGPPSPLPYRLSVLVEPAAAPSGACNTYWSRDVAVPIPDLATTTSTLFVPWHPRIADVRVHLDVSHDRFADLDLALTSPAGGSVALLTDLPAQARFQTVLDDAALLPISAAAPVSGLSYPPEAPARLGWLAGQDAGGTWTLTVADDLVSLVGTLNAWGVTICEPPDAPAPVCPAGTYPSQPFLADFEAGDPGFVHSGANDAWAIGLPAAAPITTCASGTYCWKTNLYGTYAASSSQDLRSPTIHLTGLVGPVEVAWAMDYQLEAADHAWVELQEVGGPLTKRVWASSEALTAVGGFGPSSAAWQMASGWGRQVADASEFAGKQLQVVFHLDSNATTHYAGLAVDDVGVTACRPPVCGDGVREGLEQCDDGNLVSGDGCDANCKVTACGNGVVTAGEACDDGNLVSGDGCDANCTVSACGNGIVTAGELCDDGNLVDGDGCDHTCKPTACGNGVVTAGEACDDGNRVSGDGCDTNCTVTACGNGIVTAGEQCDDGNTASGDGCSSTCKWEIPAGPQGPAGEKGKSGCGYASGADSALLGLALLGLGALRRRRAAAPPA